MAGGKRPVIDFATATPGTQEKRRPPRDIWNSVFACTVLQEDGSTKLTGKHLGSFTIWSGAEGGRQIAEKMQAGIKQGGTATYNTGKDGKPDYISVDFYSKVGWQAAKQAFRDASGMRLKETKNEEAIHDPSLTVHLIEPGPGAESYVAVRGSLNHVRSYLYMFGGSSDHADDEVRFSTEDAQAIKTNLENMAHEFGYDVSFSQSIDALIIAQIDPGQ